MSRTYRKRKCPDTDYWDVTFECEHYEDGGHYRRYLEGDELKRALARFHSDTYTWTWHVPADFRRAYNRRRRSKNKAILYCAIRDGNDEPMFRVDKKDVGYDYW